MITENEKLEWEFAPEDCGTYWYAPPGTEGRWQYTIEAEVTEEGGVTFMVSRIPGQSEIIDNIDEITSPASTLAEAKAIAQEWHRDRYDDNQAEREECRRRYKTWLMEQLENA
jgi:hypothetical protein